MSVELAWWWLPIALVVLGVLVGLWRSSRYPRGEFYDMREIVFIFWCAMFCSAAMGVVGARVLFS